MRLQTVALAAGCISQSIAKTIRIDAGPEGAGDAFVPNSVKADVGDILEFHFFTFGTSHDVVAGDFDKACAPAKTGGFYSGVISTPGGGENENVFQVVVNSTDPTFFYCSVSRHCASGMVGVVNPSGSESLEIYEENARTARASAPTSVFGGQIVPAKGSASSSGSSPPSSISSTKSPVSTTSSEQFGSSGSPTAPGPNGGSSTTAPPKTSSTSSPGGGGGNDAAAPAVSLFAVAAAIGVALLMS